jgi:hypothetical protein
MRDARCAIVLMVMRKIPFKRKVVNCKQQLVAAGEHSKPLPDKTRAGREFCYRRAQFPGRVSARRNRAALVQTKLLNQ